MVLYKENEYKFLNLNIIHMWITNSNPHKQPELVLEPVWAFKVSSVILVKPEFEKFFTLNKLTHTALKPTQALSGLFYMLQCCNSTQQFRFPFEWCCIWPLFPRILWNNCDYLTFIILLLFLTDIPSDLYSYTNEIFPLFLHNINQWIKFYFLAWKK